MASQNERHLALAEFHRRAETTQDVPGTVIGRQVDERERGDRMRGHDCAQAGFEQFGLGPRGEGQIREVETIPVGAERVYPSNVFS